MLGSSYPAAQLTDHILYPHRALGAGRAYSV
uniref:Uncharacterized protein n=1 Tax=Anguilla anguilla TaxID=7936 RepID=A0A0E9TNI1_ANGAN